MPKYGVEYVQDIQEADLVTSHAGIQQDRQIDILHCHGLYPTYDVDVSKTYLEANSYVIDNARQAKIITVPSDWVAEIFRRDMLISPRIVPHGITISDFDNPSYDRKYSYVLWAKGHASGVCDPSVVAKFSAKLRNVSCISTFGQPTANTKVIGVQPYDKMLSYIKGAGVYLATTKETFGIQTLEAMAYGVPVLGYAWGATPEIVKHGEDGWLVQPGDIDGLVAGYYQILENWEHYAKNARANAHNFSWEVACEKLWEVYQEALLDNPVTISVVIPCYNYARYLPEAINSVLAQTRPADEIIVVDDGSTDATAEVAAKFPKVKYFKIKNSGVATARNVGIQKASGTYIACLDADDKLLPTFIETLLPVISKDRTLGIVYGGILDTFEDGREVVSGWPPTFSFAQQIHKRNCIPSCNIFRKAAWQRAGGYKSRYTPAEDAELWTRMTSYGYNALKVTDSPVYAYRIHSQSLSKTRREPDWVLDKPWSYTEELTPFAAPRSELSYAVRNYDFPDVSIVIPVGPGHEYYAARAVDSVQRQSYRNWECIVVNDSGKDLIVPETGMSIQAAYPFVRIITSIGRDASLTRNLGVDAAKGSYVVFLDADDELLPEYIAKAKAEFEYFNREMYIYTDWISNTGERTSAKEFDIEFLKTQAIHPITTFIPKSWHKEISGFDTTLKGWEDWDYYLRMACSGHCGRRLPEALLMYDYSSGKRREESLKKKDSLLQRIKEVIMACRGGCGDKRRNVSSQGGTIMNRQIPEGYVLVMENSGNMGGHSVIGPITKTNYGKHKHGEVFPMNPVDQKARPSVYLLKEAADQALPQPTPQTLLAASQSTAFSVPTPIDNVLQVVTTKTAVLPNAYAEAQSIVVEPATPSTGLPEGIMASFGVAAEPPTPVNDGVSSVLASKPASLQPQTFEKAVEEDTENPAMKLMRQAAEGHADEGVEDRITSIVQGKVKYEEDAIKPEPKPVMDNTPTDFIPPVGTLSERMLRNMTIQPDMATRMLAEEEAGKHRKGVMQHLQDVIDGVI